MQLITPPTLEKHHRQKGVDVTLTGSRHALFLEEH
jgi:hypothetical protein